MTAKEHCKLIVAAFQDVVDNDELETRERLDVLEIVQDDLSNFIEDLESDLEDE